jgi:serine/threonine-protein kinase
MALSLRGIKTRYEVKEVIARGGMAVIYQAYDKVMKRPVALKTILDLTDSKSLKLFQKECEDLASLIHPNIIEIFDVGQFEDEEGTKPYLVMPLLPGVTLDNLIRTSSSRLTVERCIDIFCQTCRGLHAAHERGLIHRDLKPSNIFVMEDDSVKIIDFGVAHRLDTSQTGGRTGTLLYMSPEQIRMRPLTPASDIFSLGVVCYESLTLRRPFERSTESEVAEAILGYLPPPVHELNPSVPVPVSQAIHKAIAKDGTHRYRSAREFGDTLQKALHNEPISFFDPARLRPRLQRAHEAYDKGEYDYAGEIIGELESEGYLDQEVIDLRVLVERARIERRVSQLIETARTRMDEQEYQLALQKVDEALQLDPKNTEALALKARIDTRRTDRDVEGWFSLARTHLENRAFGPAREALRRILEFRPREPKAAQLLSEVERLEQNHQRLKGEKESLYQAAVEAERVGDLSSALSKLDRVLDLDKQAPEPSRTGTYQRQYEKVHSEYEALKAARSEAKALLDNEKFSQALAICEEYLTKYPGDTLLQALKWDIEEKQRQAVSARIAETDRRVEAESDLDRRVSILEQAVSDNPGEVYFQRALQNARDKRDGVNAIVSRGRSYEEHAQFSEALGQWEMLQVIYSRYPGLRLEIDRLNKRRDQSRRHESRARWIEQIDQQLDGGDFARAGDLVQKALEEFPEDPELTELGRLAQQGLHRHAEAQNLLALGSTACADGRFGEGVEHLRRAYDLDSNDYQIRNVLVEALVEGGRRVMESDPRAAEELLNQALVLEPNQALAMGLLRMLADQRKIETIDRALAQARRHQASGELKQALAVINEALANYPDEQRLLQAQNSLRKSIQDLRSRDLDQARRIAREVDSVTDLTEDRLGQYTDRLERYMTEYGEDKEFRDVVHGAKRRLQTLVEPPAGNRGVPGEGSANAAHAAGVPEGFDGRTQPTPNTGQRPGLRAAHNVYRTAEVFVQRAWARLSGLMRPWCRKETFIGTGAAVGLLLAIGLAVRILTPHPTKPQPTVVTEGAIAITTVPAGATVSINGDEAGAAIGPLTIRRRSGTYDLDVKLAGYQPVRQKLTIQQGSGTPITIRLVPELPTLRVLGNGIVYVDSDPPSDIQEGQFQRQLTASDHTVRVVMSRTSEVSFKVHVEADGLPVVSDISAREMTPLIANNFGPVTKIFSGTKASVPVRMNGQKVGDLTVNGLDLPTLAPNSYDLSIGDGKDAKIRTIEIGPARTLTVLLEADPNVGRLLVQTNEDGAAVVLLANGKEISRKVTQNHQAGFANLRVRGYTVQVSKDGFDTDGEKSVDLTKGAETTVSIDLRRRSKPGTILIKTTAAAEVFLDDRRVGQAQPDGSLEIPGITLGTHKVEARLKQFRTRMDSVNIGDGETKTVDLVLARAPGTVRIQRDPIHSVVTYRRTDESAEKTAGQNQLSLPEGAYVFTAKAPDYLPLTSNVVVRADEVVPVDLRLMPIRKQDGAPPVNPMETLWPKGAWEQPQTRDWFEHRGEAFLGVTRSGPGTITFDAPLSESGVFGTGRKLVWATNYVDARNYTRYELNGKNLTITTIKEGRSTKSSPKAVKPAASYSVRLEWQADSITVKINGATIEEINGEFQAGKFGFLQNKEVRMLNFRLEPGN